MFDLYGKGGGNLYVLDSQGGYGRYIAYIVWLYFNCGPGALVY